MTSHPPPSELSDVTCYVIGQGEVRSRERWKGRPNTAGRSRNPVWRDLTESLAAKEGRTVGTEVT